MKEVIIEKLEFPYNVQRKSGMYGADGTNADILFREIVDNTVDLALKFRSPIRVKALTNKDGWNYIEDNGLGMPLYLDPDFKDLDQPIIIDMMRKINVGSNITKQEYSAGTNGVGSKLSLALSDYFFFVVNATKKDPKTLPKFIQSALVDNKPYYVFYANDGHYQKSEMLDKEGVLSFFEQFNLHKDLRSYLADLKSDFGTVVIFKPSLKYLESDKVSYHGYPFKLMKTLFSFDNDLSNIQVEFNLNGKEIDPYNFKDVFKENLLEDKVFTQAVSIATEEKHPIKFIYDIGYSADKFNFDFDGSANLLKTSVGKHITLVQNAIGIAFHKFNNLIQPNDAKLGQRLFVLNMAVGHLFNSQDKTKLSKFEDRGYDEKAVIKKLADSFLKLMNDNQDYFNLLCQRILEYKKATDRLSNIELLKSKFVLGDEGDKRRILSGNMADVYDCSSEDKDKNELYIVEGKSAMGGLLKNRNKLYQAIIPLRGKLANTSEFDEERLADNKEVLAIINTIGCGIGGICDPKKSRYSKVILGVDQDSDGCLVGDTTITVKIDDQESYISLQDLFKLKEDNDDILPIIYTKSFNLLTKKIEWKLVKDVILTKYVRPEDLLVYKYSNGLGTIYTIGTKNHLFYTETGNWTRLDEVNNTQEDLKYVGDEGYFNLGTYTLNELNVREFLNKNLIPVYDIEVEDNHNFIVNGLVAHNSHIANLITTLFYQHAPEMIKQGYIYKLVAPYYLVEDGKKKEYFYQNEKHLIDFSKKVTKLKGLGSYSDEEARKFLLDPKQRKLIQLKWDPDFEQDIYEAGKLMYSGTARRNLMLDMGVFTQENVR